MDMRGMGRSMQVELTLNSDLKKSGIWGRQDQVTFRIGPKGGGGCRGEPSLAVIGSALTCANVAAFI